MTAMYLPASLALALLAAAVHPVVMNAGLLPVLSDPNVAEGGLAGKLHPVHEDVDACLMSDDLARRAFHAGSVLLYGNKDINDYFF